MNSKTPLVPLAIALMTGIVIGRQWDAPISLLPVFLAAVAIALLLRKHALLQSVAIIGCFLILGEVVSERSEVKNEKWEVRSEKWERARSYLLERLQQKAPAEDEDAYAIVAAMALGDKRALTKELRETYSITGASHVLALSGLHLSMIYALLSLMTVGRRRQFLTQMLLILCTWAFVLLVGAPKSVVRAAVMLTAYGVLSLGYRQKMSINILAFTAILMLCVSPQSLFDVGFQLSFAAVLSILLFMPLFNRLIPQPLLLRHRWLKWLWSMVAVSCAAQIGTAPLIAFYFGRFPTWFLLTNLIVVPATMLILCLSLTSLIVPSLASLLFSVAGLLNKALSWLSSLPLASIEGLHPTLPQVCVLYVISGCVFLLLHRLLPERRQVADVLP